MVLSKCSLKGKAHSNASLHQETREKSNNLTTPKSTRKERTSGLVEGRYHKTGQK